MSTIKEIVEEFKIYDWVGAGPIGQQRTRAQAKWLETKLTTLQTELLQAVEEDMKWEYDFNGKRSMALKNYNDGVRASKRTITRIFNGTK